MPLGVCQAGIEYIFWRYVYDGTEYPTGAGTGVITGAELASLYGYTDPNIIEHDWYYTDQDSVDIYLEEQCQHD